MNAGPVAEQVFKAVSACLLYQLRAWLPHLLRQISSTSSSTWYLCKKRKPACPLGTPPSRTSSYLGLAGNAMMAEVILYSFWRSSCSWRVRAVLELKGIKYEYRPIDILREKEQMSASYSHVNAMQKVPSLYIDGLQLVESYNISQYLEETRPNPALLPKDPSSRSAVREICEMIQSGIQPLQNVGLASYLPFNSQETLNWRHDCIARGFKALEQRLSKSAGRHCVGNSLTLADCFLVPQVYNAILYKVDVSKFPIISRVNKDTCNLEAFVKSHPDNQPDSPKKGL